eukprot:1158985-Pelagomonas_calceolata.AAC.2
MCRNCHKKHAAGKPKQAAIRPRLRTGYTMRQLCSGKNSQEALTLPRKTPATMLSGRPAAL